MKKLSGVLVCLLLFTFISSARIIEVADAGVTDKLKAVIAAKNAGGGVSCTVENDSALFDYTGEASADSAILNVPSGDLSTKLVLATAHTITEIVLHVRDNSQLDNLICSIYTDSGGSPDTVVADTAVVVGNADITDNPTYEDQLFTLATPKSLDSGTYWVHCIGDGSSYFESYIVSAAGERVEYSGGAYDNYAGAMGVYGCED